MSHMKMFLAGFLAVAMLHVLVTCSQEDNPSDPGPDSTVNVDQIHAGAQIVEDAFRSADPETVKTVLTEEAQARYAAQLDGIKDQMAGFADAIATRQLTAYAECYAEYRYTSGNRSLSFALALQDDGDWKLVRF